jgi:NitT/TauT family transport system substrate-binding protein
MAQVGVRSIAGAAALVAALVSIAPAQTPKPWRHGVIEPKNDAGFVLMVTQKDFAEKFGLKIEPVKLKAGGLAIKALLAGELDSIEAGAAEAVVAAAQGADLKIVGCNWPGLAHAVLVRPGIADVADLKGKTIAASAPGALPELLARTLLEKSGMTASDVKLANFGNDPDRYKALLAGAVDAAIVSTDYLPIAPKEIRLLVAARDVAPNVMRLCIAMTGKTLQERRGQAVRFLAAEIAAMRYAVAHKDETVRLTRETTGGKPDDPRPDFVFDETVKYKDCDPKLPLPMDKLAWMQEQLVKTGTIKQPIDLAKIVDPDVRTKALEIAGKPGQ